MASLVFALLSSAVSAVLAWYLGVRRERGRWQRLERIREIERQESMDRRAQRGGVRMTRYQYRR